MDDISNRTLAILLVTAIIVSLGATVSTLNKLSTGATGLATGPNATVSLEVANTLSIVLNSATVDFGAGFVNTSKANCANNATLRAGAVYYDSGGTGPSGDCWTATETPSPILVENNGNVNVTLKIIGPNATTFFNSYDGSYEYNISWRLRNNESGACNENASGVADAYQAFVGATQDVCDNMDFQPIDEDEVAIDIEVKIPADLDIGTYSNTSITITAGAVS